MAALCLCAVLLWVGYVDGSSLRRRPPPGKPGSAGFMAFEPHFSYDPYSPSAPAYWKDRPDWHDCGGPRQSPVCIQRPFVKYQHPMKPPQYLFYRSFHTYSLGSFENNGHSPTFTTFNKGQRNDYGKVLRNVPDLEQTDFVFYEIHFHIGGVARNQSKIKLPPMGSEHTVDEAGYDGEIHIVHWKRDKDTRTAEQAEHALNGIAGVAVFFKVVENCFGEVDRVIKQYVSQIPLVDNHAAVNPNLIIPSDGQFYTYRGSKTTPPCNENVIWSVYRTPIKISRASYEILINLQTSEKHMPALIKFGNYRPIQRHFVHDVRANFYPWNQELK